MDNISLKLINKSNNQSPAYETDAAAGVDLRAMLESPVILGAGERMLIPTGLYIELPLGYEAQIRPRSGLAYKHGITVLNSPGTIDADYRGELKVLLINHGKEAFEINNGERIAQMVVAQHAQCTFIETSELSDTTRGAGGFGSTGKK